MPNSSWPQRFSLSYFCRVPVFWLLLGHVVLAHALAPITDDDLLLFELRMDRYLLSDALTAYNSEDGVFLSLNEVTSYLELPIAIDAPARRADGWVIAEKRRFTLQPHGSGWEVVVDGVRHEAMASTVRVHGNDLLVEQASLGKWLPVDFKVDIANLRIDAVPREPLPVQQRILRMSRRSPGQSPFEYKPQLPLQEVPYSAFAAPHADLTLSHTVSRWENTGETEQYSRYNLIARGDLAYMSSQLFLSGSQNDSLEQARFSLERADPKGELLGPLSASRVQLGDISPSSFPMLGLNPLERGVLLERSPLGRNYDFDKVDIQGDVEPDWEVELYWNDRLSDRQLVGNDGRYAFSDVPLYYGNNNFELVFYGPDGQQRRETRSYYVGPDMLRAGRLDYQFIYSEKGQGLFEEGSPTVLPTNPGTPRATGRFSMGLGRGLSLGAGLHSVRFADVRHNYSHYELRGLMPGLGLTLRALHDSEGGDGHEGVLQSTVGGLTFRGNYFHNDGMLLESELNSLDRRISEAALAVETRLGRTPVNLRYRSIERELSSSRELSNYFTIPLERAFLSNSLTWRSTDTSGMVADTLSGSMQLNTGGQPLQWRLRTDYALQPKEEITEVALAANLRIDSRMSMNFELTHQPVTEFDRYRAGMSWRLDEALVTPSLAYDSNGNYFGYVNLSFGLGPNARGDGMRMSSDRLSAYGSVAAHVFEDTNANGLLDGGEKPSEGVVLRAKPGYHKATSGVDGYLLLGELEPYHQVDVLIDRSSIDDPMLLSRSPGAGLVPRPGRQVRLALPLQRTGEIEGTVYLQDGEARTALGGADIWLHDSEGHEIQRVRSGYDGYYLFSELPPGRYQLKLAEKYHLLEPVTPEKLQISSKGELLSGTDVVVEISRSQAVDVGAVTLPVLSREVKRRPVTPARKEAVMPSTAPVSASSGVQLGAFRDPSMARKAMQQLQAREADLVKGLKFQLQRADLGDKGVFARLVIGAMPREEAERLCNRLKVRGHDCFVISLP
jgi:hypothetical protein